MVILLPAFTQILLHLAFRQHSPNGSHQLLIIDEQTFEKYLWKKVEKKANFKCHLVADQLKSVKKIKKILNMPQSNVTVAELKKQHLNSQPLKTRLILWGTKKRTKDQWYPYHNWRFLPVRGEFKDRSCLVITCSFKTLVSLSVSALVRKSKLSYGFQSKLENRTLSDFKIEPKPWGWNWSQASECQR